MRSNEFKRQLGFSFTVIHSFGSFNNKTLKYKPNLNLVCIAMHSLVMSPCSRDLIVTSLVV